MCHPNDQEYMPIDKTWDIMPLSDMCLFVLGFDFLVFTSFNIILTIPYCNSGPS